LLIKQIKKYSFKKEKEYATLIRAHMFIVNIISSNYQALSLILIVFFAILLSQAYAINPRCKNTSINLTPT